MTLNIFCSYSLLRCMEYPNGWIKKRAVLELSTRCWGCIFMCQSPYHDPWVAWGGDAPGLTCLCAPGPGMVPGRAWGSIEVEWTCPGRLRKGKHWTVTLYLTDSDNCYFYVLLLICVICIITKTSCRRNFRNQAFWNTSYSILSGLGYKISEIIILKP